MPFPGQSFTTRRISQSYQRVVQIYVPTGSTNYLLDGTGSVLFSFPSSSLGGQLVTSDRTSSIALSASWASSSLSSSYSNSSSYALSASYALNSLSASYSLSSSYARTASFSVTASNALLSLSASSALTSSYVVYSTNTIIAINNDTSSIISIFNTIYSSIFVNYVLTDTQNFRAGNIVILYTTSSAVLSETSTADIGDSNGLQFSASLSSSFVQLLAVNSTNDDFSIKYHYEVL